MNYNKTSIRLITNEQEDEIIRKLEESREARNTTSFKDKDNKRVGTELHKDKKKQRLYQDYKRITSEHPESTEEGSRSTRKFDENRFLKHVEDPEDRKYIIECFDDLNLVSAEISNEIQDIEFSLIHIVKSNWNRTEFIEDEVINNEPSEPSNEKHERQLTFGKLLYSYIHPRIYLRNKEIYYPKPLFGTALLDTLKGRFHDKFGHYFGNTEDWECIKYYVNCKRKTNRFNNRQYFGPLPYPLEYIKKITKEIRAFKRETFTNNPIEFNVFLYLYKLDIVKENKIEELRSSFIRKVSQESNHIIDPAYINARDLTLRILKLNRYYTELKAIEKYLNPNTNDQDIINALIF